MSDFEAAARYLPHPLVSAIFIAALTFFLIDAPSLFAEYDVPWHLATGDLIRSTWSLPKTDPWSYTANGAPWVNIAWGWDVLLSGGLHYFGERNLFTLCYMAFAVILAVMCRALLARGSHEIAVLIVVCIVGAVIYNFSPARPHTASYLFTICYAMFLDRSRTSQAYSTLLALPVMMLLWVNSHGAFIIGFTVLGAYGLEACFTKDWPWLKRLVVISAACAAITVVNPYGWTIISMLVLTMDNVMSPYIIEWYPFVFGKNLYRSIFLVMFIVVSNPLRKNIPLADKILSFSWLFLALQSDRHAPIFALVSAPYVAMNISHFMGAKRFSKLSALKYRAVFISMAVATAMILTLQPVQKTLSINENSFLHPPFVPLDAINYIKRNYPNKRFYNNYNMGGYLIYYLRSPNTIFVDGRGETAYPKEVMQETISFLNFDQNWDKPLDKYNVDGLILYNEGRFYALYKQGIFHDKWDLAFEGKLANVYIRKRE